MSVAEIHGKISRSGSNISDRLEDLLTSDIFGPLRYMPSAKALKPVLERSQRYCGNNYFKISNNSENVVPKLHFWPKLTKSEPDIVIEYDNQLIMIEAKFRSGKSGHFSGVNDDEVAKYQDASSDQLGREFADLQNYQGVFDSRVLIYVTAHRTIPLNDINAGKQSLLITQKDHSAIGDIYEKNTYWLSWFQIYDSINCLLLETDNTYHRCILSDINQLLFNKGFRKFKGYDVLNINQIPHLSKKIFYT